MISENLIVCYLWKGHICIGLMIVIGCRCGVKESPRGRRHALISAGARLFLHWQCTLQWGYLCPLSWQAFEGLISSWSDRSLTSPFRSTLKCRDRHVVRILPPRRNVPCVVSHPVPYFQRLSIFGASSNRETRWRMSDRVSWLITSSYIGLLMTVEELQRPIRFSAISFRVFFKI